MRCEEVLSHLPSKVFKHVFAIKTYNDGGKLRTYYLAASSEEERMMWVGQLTAYLKLVTGLSLKTHFFGLFKSNNCFTKRKNVKLHLNFPKLYTIHVRVF